MSTPPLPPQASTPQGVPPHYAGAGGGAYTPTQVRSPEPFPGQGGGPGGGPGGDQAASRGRRRSRGLLWGVGGVLVASAVWASAVLTVPRLVATGDPAPGIGPYRLVDDLCSAARVATFNQLYPTQSGRPYHYSTRHPALDDMYCSQYLKKTGADSDYVSLYVEAQLHKAVDPKPEFEAQRAGLEQRRYQISSVPELGQEAYVGYLDDPSTSDSSWHYITQVLYVRDRGLTYYLSWSGSFQDGKTSPPDREQIRQALLIDSRDGLKALGGS